MFLGIVPFVLCRVVWMYSDAIEFAVYCVDAKIVYVYQQLPTIYRELGTDFDERVLPSIANEVLKSVVVRIELLVFFFSLFFWIHTLSLHRPNTMLHS